MTAIDENPNIDVTTTRMLVEPAYRLTGEMKTATGTVPTALKPRVALALFMANAGDPISRETLIEELWGDEPTRTAATLQTYILRIRKDLEDEQRLGVYRLLETRPNGYRLNVRTGDVDILAFAEASQGLAPLPGHDQRQLHRILAGIEACLGLAKENALEDTACGKRLQIIKSTHADRHQTVVFYRAQALVMLGRHRDALEKLTELSLKTPLHEQVAQWQMLALYRAGVPSEAAQVFGRFRCAMREELGMDPAPRTQALLQMILRQDERLHCGVDFMF